MKPEEFLRGEHCLEPAELEAFLEGRLPGAQVHLENCPACEHDLAALRDFLSAEADPPECDDLAWMEAGLRRATRARSGRSWFGWLPSALLPRLAFGGAAVLLVIAGGLQLRHMAGPSLEDSQAPLVRSAQLRGLTPAGDVDSAPAEFRWEPLAQASSYELSLTEVDGTTIWTAHGTQANLSVPDNIQHQMLPRKALLWRVRAMDEQGEVISESNPERIRVLAAAER